jgi:hypothetical protein
VLLTKNPEISVNMLNGAEVFMSGSILNQ